VLLVFLSHVGFGNVIPGGFGVTVFFFLSGYLITTLLRIEQSKYKCINLKAFYLRRTLRILPTFYLVLFVAVIFKVTGVLGGELSTSGLLSQCFMLGNYYLVRFGAPGVVAGTVVFWSLAVEEHFYLIFPAAYRKLVRTTTPPKQVIVLAGACACVLLWRCFLIYRLHVSTGYTGHTYLATDTRVDSLLFGCILAIGFNPVLDVDSHLTYSRSAKWAPLALLALLFTFIDRNDAVRETFRYTIQGVALMPLFVLAIKGKGTLAFRLLNQKHLRFVGAISYSLYLVHACVIEVVKFTLHSSPIIDGLVALLISMGLAALIHQTLELGCYRLRRKLLTSGSWFARSSARHIA
jgi:peptidoglycan/LPS O-acetylase OafA/YrhL